MSVFNSKVKVLATAIFVAFTFLLLAFLPSCPYKFNERTYKGTTSGGSLIAISLTSKGGKITGYGCHLFRSGDENYISISGTIDCKSGRINFKENYTSDPYPFFGAISGMLTKDKTSLIGGWTNSYGRDNTEINLEFTEKIPSEVLATESIQNIGSDAINFGRTAKARLKGFAKGFLSRN